MKSNPNPTDASDPHLVQRLQDRMHAEEQLGDAVTRADLVEVLMILRDDIVRWSSRLKSCVYQHFSDEFSLERFMCDSQDGSPLRPGWAVIPFVGAYEAFEMLEFAHGNERASMLARRIDGLGQSRHEFSEFVAAHSRETMLEMPLELGLRVDEAIKDLRAHALNVASYLDVLICQLRPIPKHTEESDWLSVTEAAKLLVCDVDGLDLRKAKARVSAAASRNAFKTNQTKGPDRRIEPGSFSSWRIEQREKNLNAVDS